MDKLYLETTVIGHLAGRIHPDRLISNRQLVTREWWSTAASLYELLISDMVVDECKGGDSSAATERLSVISEIPLLKSSEEVDRLAQAHIDGNAVPQTEIRDAFHIAIAAVNGEDYLATWNFKHILNPATQTQIELVCRNAGFEPAVICTPEQFFEAERNA